MNTNPNVPTLALDNDLIKFLVSYGQKKVIPAGEIFITEGDDSHNCFVLLDGAAEILKKDENGKNTVVVNISKGTIVGEMGVFLQEKRGTSVRAETPLILLEFTAARFYSAVERAPNLALRIIKSLAEKLNAANKHAVSIRQ